MLDSFLDAVVIALKSESISAFREFPEKRADVKTGVSVSVGLGDCKCVSSGMGEYIGTRAGEGGSDDTELFGRRMELTLLFEIYSPVGAPHGAAACVKCTDRLRDCMAKLPSGLKALEMESGEVCMDEKLACFRCVCTIRALAFLVAESDGTETEFLDFVLKGTVDSGN
ncbi:MAG: hypothetical protein CVU91_08820 [Firmicutes bacterium HGW-Firmicutes-16]|nr:MAG: hypothetical protein CVU91_08820 [Firmicutes bacterium HGW-Firmicutes-16]